MLNSIKRNFRNLGRKSLSAILSSSLSLTSIAPAFSEYDPKIADTNYTWDLVNSPTDELQELESVNGYLFSIRNPNPSDSLQNGPIFRSENNGDSWSQMQLPPPEFFYFAGKLYDMDDDLGNLYISCDNGILMTKDNGKNFDWSFLWYWDPTTSVDFKNGYGWATVKNWGSMSGPIRLSPEGYWERQRGNITWAEMSMSNVVSDSLDPLNIAYADNWRTKDGGETWERIGAIDFNVLVDGTSTAIRQNQYSQDYGRTWRNLGISPTALERFEQSGQLFAGTQNGVYIGRPQNWQKIGLNNVKVKSLTLNDDYLFALTNGGDIYRSDISPELSKVEKLFNLSNSWHNTTDANDLIKMLEENR